MSTHRKPAAVPIRRAAPALIPAAVAGWVTLPEMRPIITLTTAVIAAVSIYAWTQTRPWAPRAGIDAARAAGRRIGRPPALTDEQRDFARRLRAQGEGVATIARVLEVSPSTIRRALTAL